MGNSFNGLEESSWGGLFYGDSDDYETPVFSWTTSNV